MNAAAQELLAAAGRPHAEVSVLLVDDSGIRALNRNWRGVDRPTDVLSWAQQEDRGGGGGDAAAEKNRAPLPAGAPLQTGDLLGDVVISLETAARQAGARGWSLGEEVALLLVHGILHLLGHEDETEAGAEEMRRIEARILGKPLDKPPRSGQGTIPA
jgi:probable rRNA maturation factor